MSKRNHDYWFGMGVVLLRDGASALNQVKDGGPSSVRMDVFAAVHPRLDELDTVVPLTVRQEIAAVVGPGGIARGTGFSYR